MNALTPYINATSTAILFGIIQGISIIGLFKIKGIIKEHRFFIVLVCVLLLVQAETFLIRSGYITHFLILLNTSIPFIFLIGPALLMYIFDRMEIKYSGISMLIHGLPFILYFMYSFNFFAQPEAFKFNAVVRSFYPHLQTVPFQQTFRSDPLHIQGWVVVEFLSLHLLTYCLLSMVIIFRHQKEVQAKVEITWFKFLTATLGLAAIVLFLSQGGVVNGFVFFESPFPQYAPDLSVVLVMYSTTVYLILSPDNFRYRQPKYQKSSLASDFMRKNLDKITCLLETEKLYLQADYSLDMLSLRCGLTKHHISQILNEELNVSFYDFTHQYRIQEAKRILDNTDQVKMEQLAYSVGYKSKATFFSAFKKATDLTPLQYKGRFNAVFSDG